MAIRVQQRAQRSVWPLRRATPESVENMRRSVMLDQALPAMIEAVPDYAFILNEERQVLAVNSRLLQTFGVNRIEALVGKRPGEALGCLFRGEGGDGCGSDIHCAVCGAAKSINESQRFNVQATHEFHLGLDGDEATALDLLVVSTPMVIGDLKLTFCVLRDISAEKRRSVLERIFFHDVINTAGGIRGIASLLARGETNGKEQDTEFRQWLVELSERLIDEITHQRKLLAAEKGEFTPDLSLIHVPVLLMEVHALYANHEVAAGVNLVLDAIPDCKILSDAAILRRILGNLAKNAIEATSHGETVTISATEQPATVTFSICNPGVMPAEVQLQLFQRSFSTKGTEGRGIGTYSVKLFAERYLKGKVFFVSREPEGTIFSVTIPKGI
ncbi:MAG TPA: HAMP domain-containing sensor histidine kinase [Geobacteraceae bacterium]